MVDCRDCVRDLRPLSWDSLLKSPFFLRLLRESSRMGVEADHAGFSARGATHDLGWSAADSPIQSAEVNHRWNGTNRNFIFRLQRNERITAHVFRFVFPLHGGIHLLRPDSAPDSCFAMVPEETRPRDGYCLCRGRSVWCAWVLSGEIGNGPLRFPNRSDDRWRPAVLGLATLVVHLEGQPRRAWAVSRRCNYGAFGRETAGA